MNRVQAYMEGLLRLEEIRLALGDDSPEEDEHLDEMDFIWYELSSEEMREANDFSYTLGGDF